MKKRFDTPEGIIERELTEDEIKKYAEIGDNECRKHLANGEFLKAIDLQQKIDIIARYLGLI